MPCLDTRLDSTFPRLVNAESTTTPLYYFTPHFYLKHTLLNFFILLKPALKAPAPAGTAI